MKGSNNLTPPTDLLNSREYYGMYNSRDFYKGTSFKMSGEWMPNTHYFNDEYIIDFVSYNGSLWVCQRSHLSTEEIKPAAIGFGNRYWIEVITGVEGKAYVPVYNETTGELTFELDGTPPNSPINIKNLKGPKGEDGINGINGIDGKTYIPDRTLKNGHIIVFRNTKDNSDYIEVDCVNLRGRDGKDGKNGVDGVKGDKGTDGKTPSLISSVNVTTIASNLSATAHFIYSGFDENGNPRYQLNLSIPKGEPGIQGLQGIQGIQGQQGKPGPSPKFKLEIDNELKTTILYYTFEGNTNWIRLGEVGGKSPKLIRVLGDASNPDTQDNTRRNDRILWGYDGIPVSEWTTLCYLDELRGDENIAYGCPSDFKGGEPSIDKIWYDPCDDAVDQFSISDFLYQSYLSIGGDLPKDEFEKVFASLNTISGFEIKFADSFESLGEPTKDKLNKLWLIPAEQSDDNNLFEEYIVVHSPSTPEDTYMWEKWGSKGVTVDLSRYTLVSPDSSISIEHKDNLTEMKVNTSSIVNANSAIQSDSNGKIDIYWEGF